MCEKSKGRLHRPAPAKTKCNACIGRESFVSPSPHGRHVGDPLLCRKEPNGCRQVVLYAGQGGLAIFTDQGIALSLKLSMHQHLSLGDDMPRQARRLWLILTRQSPQGDAFSDRASHCSTCAPAFPKTFATEAQPHYRQGHFHSRPPPPRQDLYPNQTTSACLTAKHRRPLVIKDDPHVCSKALAEIKDSLEAAPENGDRGHENAGKIKKNWRSSLSHDCYWLYNAT